MNVVMAFCTDYLKKDMQERWEYTKYSTENRVPSNEHSVEQQQLACVVERDDDVARSIMPQVTSLEDDHD